MSGEASVWNPRTIVEISGNNKRVTQQFIAVAGQTAFIITDFAYTVGTGALAIYKRSANDTTASGLSLVPPNKVAEIGSTAFALVEACSIGDIVLAVGSIDIIGSVDTVGTNLVGPLYKGDWVLATGTAKQGWSYSYAGRQWVLKLDTTDITSVAPAQDNSLWLDISQLDKAYDSALAYNRGEEFLYLVNGLYYICFKDAPAGTVPTNVNYFYKKPINNGFNDFSLSKPTLSELIADTEAKIDAGIIEAGYVLTSIEYYSGSRGGNKYFLMKSVNDISRPTEDGGSIIYLSPSISEGWYLKGIFSNSISPSQFGVLTDGTPQSADKLNAFLAYGLSRKTSETLFNAITGSSNLELDFEGRNYILTTSMTFPSTGGGGVVFSNGSLTAHSTFDTSRYVLEANTSTQWFIRVSFDNFNINANRRGGCLRTAYTHNWDTKGLRLNGFVTEGWLYESPATSNSADGMFIYEYHYGQTGFDDPNAHNGTAILVKGTDLRIGGAHIGYGLNGVRFESGGNYLGNGTHMYGLTGLAIDEAASGTNEITDVYLDDPCKISMQQGYESIYKGIRFRQSTPQPYMMRIKPTSSVNLSNINIVCNTFTGTAYTVPNSSLTLSSATVGDSRTLTISSGYFTSGMVGSTIKETGVCVITSYTNSTSVIVRVLEKFNSTAISSGSWSQIPTSIFVDESNFALSSNGNDVNVENNTFSLCQPKYSTPKRRVSIAATESSEIEFGGVLIPYNSIKACHLTPINSNSATMENVKALYAAGTVVAFDFEAAYTGDIAITVETSEQKR